MHTLPFKVRDVRKRDWFSADNLVLDVYAKHVGAIGIAIYFTLCRRADEEQKCFPSQKNIAEMLCIKEKTVRKYLKRLVQTRLIFIEKDFRNKKGIWLHDVYWLLDKSEWLHPSEKITDGNGRNIKSEPSELNDEIQGNVVPTNNTNTNNTHKNDTNNAKRSFADVDMVIQKFSSINPSYEGFYTNKTQRNAVERLIKSMGIEKISLVIEALVGVIKKPYCPMIISPYDLEKKQAQLFVFLERQKKDHFGEKGIAGITEPFKESKYARFSI